MKHYLSNADTPHANTPMRRVRFSLDPSKTPVGERKPTTPSLPYPQGVPVAQLKKDREELEREIAKLRQEIKDENLPEYKNALQEARKAHREGTPMKSYAALGVFEERYTDLYGTYEEKVNLDARRKQSKDLNDEKKRTKENLKTTKENIAEIKSEIATIRKEIEGINAEINKQLYAENKRDFQAKS